MSNEYILIDRNTDREAVNRMYAERLAERIETEQAVNERVNAKTSHDIDEEVKITNKRIVSKSVSYKVKAKNSIIERIRAEEDENMNLRYIERRREEQPF